MLEYVHDWNKAEADRWVLELLGKVGLTEKASAHAARLSGGQRQRVAITRALALSSQIVLFGESVSVLDPKMIGEVSQTMKSLAHGNITMIVVTHGIHFAREIVDRMVLIDGGDILEVTTPRDFFVRPRHLRTQRFLKKVLDPLH